MEQHTIIRALRDYELEEGYTPTRLGWDATRRRYTPCSRTIVRVFGSWNNAMNAAGLDPNQPGWGRRTNRNGI